MAILDACAAWAADNSGDRHSASAGFSQGRADHVTAIPPSRPRLQGSASIVQPPDRRRMAGALTPKHPPARSGGRDQGAPVLGTRCQDPGHPGTVSRRGRHARADLARAGQKRAGVRRLSGGQPCFPYDYRPRLPGRQGDGWSRPLARFKANGLVTGCEAVWPYGARRPDPAVARSARPAAVRRTETPASCRADWRRNRAPLRLDAPRRSRRGRDCAPSATMAVIPASSALCCMPCTKFRSIFSKADQQARWRARIADASRPPEMHAGFLPGDAGRRSAPGRCPSTGSVSSSSSFGVDATGGDGGLDVSGDEVGVQLAGRQVDGDPAPVAGRHAARRRQPGRRRCRRTHLPRGRWGRFLRPPG